MSINSVWAELPSHPSKGYDPRMVATVDLVVIHHSAGAWRSDGDTVKQLRAFARQHVNGYAWPGIGYHYAIDPAGEIFKTQPISRITWHALGANAKGIGVVLIGNFEKTNPPPKQLASLTWLLAELKREMPGIKQVIGHRDAPKSHTLCPGRNFTAEMIRGLNAHSTKPSKQDS